MKASAGGTIVFVDPGVLETTDGADLRTAGSIWRTMRVSCIFFARSRSLINEGASQGPAV